MTFDEFNEYDESASDAQTEEPKKKSKKQSFCRPLIYQLRQQIEEKAIVLWDSLKGEKSDQWMLDQYLALLKGSTYSAEAIRDAFAWLMYLDDKRQRAHMASFSPDPDQFTLFDAQQCVLPTTSGVVKVVDATWPHLMLKVERSDRHLAKIATANSSLHSFIEPLRELMEPNPVLTCLEAKNRIGQWK